MKILSWLAATLATAAAQTDYCGISPQHTLCQYQGVGQACGQPLGRGTTTSEQQEILDYHNRLRSRVASGSTGQPPASNMLQLTWDHELAATAQRLADQCKFKHDCADCRKLSKFSVGQNLYQSFTSRQGGKNSWRVAIDAWFNEISKFPASSVSFYAFSSDTGHYSQIVWAETSSVGCGVTTYQAGRLTARLYVCNYGKGGNFLRKPVYKIGSACSACPGSSSCSDSYPGLCIEGRSPAPQPQRPQPAPTQPARPTRPSRPSRPCFGFFCFIGRPFNLSLQQPVSMVGDVAMMGVNTAFSGLNSASNGVTNLVSSGTNFVANGINTVSRPVSNGINAVSRPIASGINTGVSLTASGVNFVSRPAIQAVNSVSRPAIKAVNTGVNLVSRPAIQAVNSGVNFVSRPFRFPSRAFSGK